MRTLLPKHGLLAIQNVVINLESSTIKWCQITKLLREKTEMGQEPKAYVFLVWTAENIK
jgi:hypothetical protein